MNGRKLIALAIAGGLVSAVSLVAAVPAFGDSTATVKAQVIVGGPCVSYELLPSASSSRTDVLDFGALPLGSPQTPSLNRLNITNCGDLAESILASATDATATDGSITWELSGSPADCTHSSATTNAYGFGVTAGVTRLQLLHTNQPLAAALQPGLNIVGPGDINMACPGSGGAGKTMTFSLVFTAVY